MKAKAEKIAAGILDGAGPAEDKFLVGAVMLIAGFGVCIELVKKKKITTMRAADLLFDLRASLQELELALGRSN